MSSSRKRPKLIVSGGQGSDELIAEAEAMARYSDGTWVPEDAILIENRLSYFFENLTFSKRILEEEVFGKRVLVVTNSFHALRAGVFMRRLKIPGRSIGSRTAFTISHPLGFEETVGLVFTLLEMACYLPSFSISALVLYTNHELIEFFMQHLKLKEAGQNCPAFYA